MFLVLLNSLLTFRTWVCQENNSHLVLLLSLRTWLATFWYISFTSSFIQISYITINLLTFINHVLDEHLQAGEISPTIRLLHNISCCQKLHRTDSRLMVHQMIYVPCISESHLVEKYPIFRNSSVWTSPEELSLSTITPSKSSRTLEGSIGTTSTFVGEHLPSEKSYLEW